MKAQGVGPLRLPRRSRLAGRVCSRPRAWGRRTAYVQATSRAQSGAQRGIIFFAATEVRILPARHIEQPRRHAVHPCAPTMPGEILAAAARWQRRSSDANRLCCAVSAKSVQIPPAMPADFDPNGFRSSSPTTPATQSVSAARSRTKGACGGEKRAGDLVSPKWPEPDRIPTSPRDMLAPHVPR
jgi:hypothetical protein